MDDLRSVLLKGSKGVLEEDEFYEKLEAPKFVDLVAPDRSRTDDKAWFCVRIGCDQQHEEVDPEALFKSFKLRVLAARSPNLRIQRSLNRRDARSISNCPHSAPAKSVNPRFPRSVAATTGIPEKRVISKLKDHPISSLRSTPNNTKAKEQPLRAEKALTTPRKKKCPIKEELFRSVKYQKPPIPVQKNASVAKALVFRTPKKATQSTTTTRTPVLDTCAEIRKLKITSVKKTAPRGVLCSSSRSATQDFTSTAMKTGDSVYDFKRKIKGCPQKSRLPVLQEAVHKDSVNEKNGRKLRVVTTTTTTTNAEEQLPSSLESNLKDSLQTESASGNSELLTFSDENVRNASTRSGTETESVETATNCDDNKENISENHTSRISECESSQIENCENHAPKAIRLPSKKIQESLLQGEKHRRTTNPKPFRLRTDERGVLREANLERRHQLEVQKGTALALRSGNGMQEKNSQIDVDKSMQKAQTKGDIINCAKLIKSASTKFVTSKQCQRLEISKEKIIEKSHDRIVKVASTRQIVKTSVAAVKKVPICQLQRNNTTKSEILCLQRKAKTIPKEPNFHKIHLPKDCTKRPEIVIP